MLLFSLMPCWNAVEVWNISWLSRSDLRDKQLMRDVEQWNSPHQVCWKSLNHHEILYTDWIQLISGSTIERLILLFSICHAGNNGYRRADSPAGDNDIDNRQQPHTGPTFCHPVRFWQDFYQQIRFRFLCSLPPDSQLVQAGEGAAFNSRGAAC